METINSETYKPEQRNSLLRSASRHINSLFNKGLMGHLNILNDNTLFVETVLLEDSDSVYQVHLVDSSVFTSKSVKFKPGKEEGWEHTRGFLVVTIMESDESQVSIALPLTGHEYDSLLEIKRTIGQRTECPPETEAGYSFTSVNLNGEHASYRKKLTVAATVLNEIPEEILDESLLTTLPAIDIENGLILFPMIAPPEKVRYALKNTPKKDNGKSAHSENKPKRKKFSPDNYPQEQELSLAQAPEEDIPFACPLEGTAKSTFLALYYPGMSEADAVEIISRTPKPRIYKGENFTNVLQARRQEIETRIRGILALGYVGKDGVKHELKGERFKDYLILALSGSQVLTETGITETEIRLDIFEHLERIISPHRNHFTKIMHGQRSDFFPQYTMMTIANLEYLQDLVVKRAQTKESARQIASSHLSDTIDVSAVSGSSLV